MLKQWVVSLAVAAVATGLAASAQAQSGIAALSPAAQAEIQKLSPAQRAALAHSLLGDTAVSAHPVTINPAAGTAPARSSSVAQAGSVAAAPAVAMVPASAAPAYDWNGCYAAAGVGAGMFNDEHHIESLTAHAPIVTSSTSGGSGLLGRFGAGCDYQVAPRIVLGAFGDLDLGNLSGTFAEPGFTSRETEQWAWSAGVRGGYLLWPQTLAYIDTGFTQARFQLTDANLAVPPAPPTGIHFGAYVANGVFGGAGFEMALDFLPGAFWRNEYRYAYYFGMNVPLTGASGGLVIPPGLVDKVQPSVQTITTSFVYKLDWNRFLQ
ncbi:MAG TPA: outer membrane beta-barrel protein [Stellaceae bacterium]